MLIIANPIPSRAIFRSNHYFVMKIRFFTIIGIGVLGGLIGLKLELILHGHHFIHGKFKSLFGE